MFYGNMSIQPISPSTLPPPLTTPTPYSHSGSSNHSSSHALDIGLGIGGGVLGLALLGGLGYYLYKYNNVQDEYMEVQ